MSWSPPPHSIASHLSITSEDCLASATGSMISGYCRPGTMGSSRPGSIDGSVAGSVVSSSIPSFPPPSYVSRTPSLAPGSSNVSLASYSQLSAAPPAYDTFAPGAGPQQVQIPSPFQQPQTIPAGYAVQSQPYGQVVGYVQQPGVQYYYPQAPYAYAPHQQYTQYPQQQHYTYMPQQVQRQYVPSPLTQVASYGSDSDSEEEPARPKGRKRVRMTLFR